MTVAINTVNSTNWATQIRLTYGTKDVTTLPATNAWFSVSMSTIVMLQPYTTYALVSNDTNGNTVYRLNANLNIGTLGYSPNNNGATYTPIVGTFLFEIYGS